MTRHRVLHLQRELVVTRPLAPQQAEAGLGDVREAGMNGLAGCRALGGVTGQLTGPRLAQLIDSNKTKLVGCARLQLLYVE